jgi:uncharacterized delta-60 repeat protein
VDGTFLTTISNSVNCLALQPDGKILVGGSFKGVSGQVRMYLARLNADGSLDADFNPGANNTPYALALQPDGMILAGGRFTSLGSGGGSYLARLDATGAADTTYYPSPNDYVYSLAVAPSGQTIVAGRFTWLGGQGCNHIGRLNTDGTLDTAFDPGADGNVYSVVLQADGKILVGGSFTNLVGQPCKRIGRFNADGTFDATFNPGASSTVYGLALQADGKVLACGSFTNLGGQARSYLGRLSNTALPAETLQFSGNAITWLRSGTGPEAWRASFAVTTNGSDWTSLGDGARISGGWQRDGLALPAQATVRGRCFVSGGEYNGSSSYVETIAGFPRIISQPVSRTNNPGTIATFSAGAIGSPVRYQWRKAGLPLADTGNVSGSATATLVLSNVFGNDTGKYSLVVSNSSGSVTSTVATLTVLDPLITNQPISLLLNAGQTAALSVGAIGTPLHFQWRKDGFTLSAATTSALTLTNVQWADRGGYDVVVSNAFGVLTSAVAQVTVNLASPDSFRPNPNGMVRVLAEQPDGSLLLGGAFNSIAGQPRTNFCRFSADTTLDPTFLPTFFGGGSFSPGLWAAALLPDGKMLVVGDIYVPYPDGQNRSYIARLNPDAAVDSAFSFSAIGWLTTATMQPDGRTLIAGGAQFSRVETNGVTEAGFNPVLSGYVNSVALQTDGKIVVGGYLTGLNSMGVTNLGRLNADGSADTNFVAAADTEVYALAVQADGKILVGGTFSTLCGQPRNQFGRLNADGTLDLAFNPVLGGVGPSSGTPNYNQPFVYSIALQADGKIIIGGRFTNLCGQARSCLGRLYPDGTIDPTFNPWAEGLDAYAGAVALQADGKVLVGGQFTSLGGSPASWFGRLLNPDAATQNLALAGATITWLRGGASPELYGTAFDYSTNGTSWVSLGNGVRTWGGWQLTGVSVPPSATLRARGFVAGGSDNRSSWYVETILGKPAVVSQPVSRTNNAATFASFNVVASGAPPLVCQWYKDSLALQDGGSISGAHTPALAITNVLRANAGSYSVIVSNAGGAVTSAVATLTVVDPIITGQPASQAVNPGSNVIFSVTAAGTDLHYQWRRNGTNLPAATDSSLNLPSVQSSQAGVYDAVVSNAFGVLYTIPVMLTVNTVFTDTFYVGVAGGQVDSLALQTDGKILAAGEFSSLAGSARTLVGRLTPAGSLDGFNPNVDGYSAVAVALQANNQVLLGGYFFHINGQTHNRLGRLNADGSLDTTFGYNVGNWLYCFTTLPDGKFLVGSDPEGLRRFNPDGTLDNSFNAAVAGPVLCAAMLPDGRFLVGPSLASFKALLRLNADGSLDPAFNVPLDGVNTSISSIVLQADGKILVGGSFTSFAGQPRTNLARLNPDGTLDLAFRADADSYVSSLALQTDGNILVGGAFGALAGQSRSRLARLSPDGSLDLTFNPGADGNVFSLALQADGRILVGGSFSRLAGVSRTCLGRLSNTTAATQTLGLDGSDIVWMRQGASPELGFASFAISTNGVAWTDLGLGTRVPGGWRLSGVAATTNSLIRARGFVTGAQWFIEQTNAVGPLTPPKLAPTSSLGSNRFTLSVKALPGQVVVIEASTNFVTWMPVQTNLITATRGFLFADANSGAFPRRFYRARLYQGPLPPPAIGVGNDGPRFQTNGFGFSLAGVAGTTVIVEASTNLLNWAGLATNTLSGGPVYFTDPASTHFPRRFYRARFP